MRQIIWKGLGCALLATAFANGATAGETKAAKAPTTRGQLDTAPTQESTAKAMEEEKQIYLQRLSVCDKLRQIANARDDDALRQKAEKLEEMAFDLYMQRTSKLPVVVSEDPKPVSTTSATPERRAERPSSTGRAPNGRPIKEGNP